VFSTSPEALVQDPYDTRQVKLFRTSQQMRIDAYFQANSSYWKDIYDAEGVQGEIYRTRQLTVLEWVESLGCQPNSRILEIGCGAGRLAVELARQGFQVHAVDSVPAMVELTRQHVAESRVARAVTVAIGSAYSLDCADESFDVVIAVGVIPWLYHAQAAMHEMARVTRRGGLIILSADNSWRLIRLFEPGSWLVPALAPIKRHVKQALERAGNDHRPADDLATSCHRLHQPGRVDRMLTYSGLKKVKGVTLGFGPFTVFGRTVLPEPFGTRLHRRLQNLAWLGTPVIRSTGTQYLVLAKRPELVVQSSSPSVEARMLDVTRVATARK
jgi:ubiquinone/menaquinone biosynthesis C-methylase UbiE